MVEILAQPQELDKLPAQPGVYIFKDEHGHALYVGKAVNLRSRVKSYFTRSADNRFSVAFLRRQARYVECIITANEKEAFLLENELIKRLKPRYNIRLRDDKTYVSLRFRMNHPYPRLEIVRIRRYAGERLGKGDLYFGPYVSTSAVRATLRFLLKIFPVRTCRDTVFANRTRPCLLYDVGKCCAPCVLPVSQEYYRTLVDRVARFLRGRREEVRELLEQQMYELSQRMEFERAALVRDYLQAMEETLERQTVVSHAVQDRDVVAIVSEAGRSLILLMEVRDGAVVNTSDFFVKNFEQTNEEVLSQFFSRHYESANLIPPEIVTNIELADRELLEEWLRDLRGANVEIRTPKRGASATLVATAEANARARLALRARGEKTDEEALADLAARLGLERVPHSIECVDISNLMGTLAVGSIIRFERGRPFKEGYRRYRIKTVQGANDFAMMREVLLRRFRPSSSRALPSPDLLLVDGGKAQLGVARKIAEELGLQSVMLAALAKARRDSGGRLVKCPGDESDKGGGASGSSHRLQERLFVPNRKNPIILPGGSAALFLVQRIRDEAHRFAITYHRKLRAASHRRSVLEEIPGVGSKRAKLLLRHFGSLARIKSASVEELAGVPGMNRALAQQILRFFSSLEQLGEHHQNDDLPESNTAVHVTGEGASEVPDEASSELSRPRKCD
ncbi:MAG: excinuclease ABC subunit UvrC [Candidatus Sumerlaeaceae bacterium]|nr:excinuclease ABC subunit UvrC [Candidatus Sumerlaeaceae bacterium]